MPYTEYQKLGDKYKVRRDVQTHTLEVFQGSVRVATLSSTEVDNLVAYLVEGYALVDVEQVRANLTYLEQFIHAVEHNAVSPSRYRSHNFTAIDSMITVAKGAFSRLTSMIERD